MPLSLSCVKRHLSTNFPFRPCVRFEREAFRLRLLSSVSFSCETTSKCVATGRKMTLSSYLLVARWREGTSGMVCWEWLPPGWLEHGPDSCGRRTDPSICCAPRDAWWNRLGFCTAFLQDNGEMIRWGRWGYEVTRWGPRATRATHESFELSTQTVSPCVLYRLNARPIVYGYRIRHT